MEHDEVPERRPTRVVFLSYSRRSRSFDIERFAADLSIALGGGYTVWYDRKDLVGGEAWPEHLPDLIAKSVVVVPIVTSTRVSRWVREETLEAFKKRIPVIPVRARNTQMPFGMNALVPVDLWLDYDSAVLDLASRIGGEEHRISETARATGGLEEQLNAYLERIQLQAADELPIVAAVDGPKQLEFELTVSADGRRVAVGSTSDAVDLLHRSRAALVADGGSGKTVLLWAIADYLASGGSSSEVAIPIFVPLRTYSGADPLMQHLVTTAEVVLGGLSRSLEELLERQRVVLLIDGLNEVAARDRTRVFAELKRWMLDYPDVGLLATSRAAEDARALELDVMTIEPLSLTSARSYLERRLGASGRTVFHHLAGGALYRTYLEPFLAAGGREADFWDADDDPELESVHGWHFWCWPYWQQMRDADSSGLNLLRSPFLLSLLVDEWSQSLSLVATRGELLHSVVNRLVHGSKSDLVPIDEDEALSILSRLAHRMTSEGLHAVDWTTCESFVGARDAAALKSARLTSLLKEADSSLSFRHHIFQEFLAAYEFNRSRLAGGPADAIWPAARWWEPVGWEETTLFSAGLFDHAPTDVARWLQDANPELAANCLRSAGGTVNPGVLDEMRAAWERRLVSPDEPPEARAAIGRALGVLQLDKRHGVTTVDADGLPVIAWSLVESGPFIVGADGSETQHLIDHEYWYSTYLVTNAQYERFVLDGGYSDDRWSHVWTDAGRLWRVDRSGPQFYSEVLRLPNHPQIGVTWYEAVAYCGWLTERSRASGALSEDLEIRLPTELEWEKAARGIDGRPLPFGKYFLDSKANIRTIEATTAVGIYTEGASPWGIHDMIGNCWKWCLTKWNPETYANPDNDTSGGDWRCYRGDSWGADRWRDFSMNWRTSEWSPGELHCGNRYGIVPEDDRPDAIGFHIVLAPNGSVRNQKSTGFS